LNSILGLDYEDLENDVPISEITNVSPTTFRNRLAKVYFLELTNEELIEMIGSNITTREFTERYCPTIYSTREGSFDSLIESSMKDGALDLRELDSAPRYGLNGTRWCDVANGPCSCGAWHR